MVITKPRYLISLCNSVGEIDRIETNGPKIMLSEAVRQKLLTDWRDLSPGDTIRIIDTYEED